MLIVISVTQQWKYLHIGNFPPYVNFIYILAECPGSLLLMKQRQT